jgi:hypothetical protein
VSGDFQLTLAPLRPPQHQAESAIEYLTDLVVALAKFQTSEMMGEREQAFGYLERHV